MPAYIVSTPTVTGATTRGKVNRVIVFAEDSADAIAMAKAFTDVGGNAIWAAATVTEIAVASDMTGWRLSISVSDTANAEVADIVSVSSGIAVTSVTINAGGTGYNVNDVITVSNGTSTRACTAKVTSESGNVVDGIELTDPGEYTVAPATTGEATTGGGSGLTLDTTNAADSYHSLLANAVSVLNATASIAGAAVNFGSGLLLTIADGGGGDDLGDHAVIAQVFPPLVSIGEDIAIPGFLSTVTDEGASNAVLSVALPASIPAIPGVPVGLVAK